MPGSASLPSSVLRIHIWVRSQPWLGRFTLANRVLLAFAFFPTGWVKVTGQRFTTLPVSDSVGFFFEAMYRTGPYWNFIGAMQVLAAILLLIPRTAALGAVLIVPIVSSIFLITWGIGFSGTVYVAAGMLLSAFYLVCWDADRIWLAATCLVGRTRGPKLLDDATWIERSGWALGGVVGIAFFLVVRGQVPHVWIVELLIVGVVAIGMVVAGWIVGFRRQT